MMKLLTIAVVLAAMSVVPLHGEIRTKFYRTMVLYPSLDRARWAEFVASGLRGSSECDLLDTAQKAFFYEEPALRDPVPVYEKGAYIVIENTTQRTVTVEEPVTRFRVVLEYGDDRPPVAGRIVRKVTMYRMTVIDTVVYRYDANGRFSARSTLYGRYRSGQERQ